MDACHDTTLTLIRRTIFLFRQERGCGLPQRLIAGCGAQRVIRQALAREGNRPILTLSAAMHRAGNACQQTARICMINSPLCRLFRDVIERCDGPTFNKTKCQTSIVSIYSIMENDCS
jgi:hypothetical protein